MQVVFAHPPHRCSPSSGDRQLTLFVTGYSRCCVGIFQRTKPAALTGREKSI